MVSNLITYSYACSDQHLNDLLMSLMQLWQLEGFQPNKG